LRENIQLVLRLLSNRYQQYGRYDKIWYDVLMTLQNFLLLINWCNMFWMSDMNDITYTRIVCQASTRSEAMNKQIPIIWMIWYDVLMILYNIMLLNNWFNMLWMSDMNDITYRRIAWKSSNCSEVIVKQIPTIWMIWYDMIWSLNDII